MIPNFERSGLKSKTVAIKHIIECLMANPNCAGSDGTCMVFAFGNWMSLKPVKKKNATAH